MVNKKVYKTSCRSKSVHLWRIELTGLKLSIAYADDRVLVVTIYGKRNARYDIIRFVGMDHLRLTEENVPGAKLTTSPSKCKVALLHRWLSCHGVTHSGLRKAEFVERYTSYSVVLVVSTLCSCTSADRVKSVIKSGEEWNVIDPDGGVHERRKLEELQKAGSIDYAAFPQLKPRPVLDESKWSTQLLYSALHKLTLEILKEYTNMLEQLSAVNVVK